jgi:hypothetical protein
MKKVSKKKMMTGGMANQNTKAVAAKVATGKSGGGGNTPATKQTSIAGKSSGGVNTPPTGAIPAAMHGGKMKMGGKMSYGGKMSMKKMGKKK